MTASSNTAASQDLGVLPNWDLGDLYPAPDSPVLAADLDRAQGLAEAFRTRYEGKIAGLSGAALSTAIG